MMSSPLSVKLLDSNCKLPFGIKMVESCGSLIALLIVVFFSDICVLHTVDCYAFVQLLRLRRPFAAYITDAMGNEMFRVWGLCAFAFGLCNKCQAVMNTLSQL